MCAIAGVACMPLCVFVCVYPRVRVTETIPSLDHLIKAGERKKKKSRNENSSQATREEVERDGPSRERPGAGELVLMKVPADFRRLGPAIEKQLRQGKEARYGCVEKEEPATPITS